MEVSRARADTRRLAGVLGRFPAPRTRPAFIVVSGLPGTGKSYFCQRLAERLDYPVLESDALRKRLFLQPDYSVAESARLFRAIHELTEALLGEGRPVILDATNLTERHRETLHDIAGRTGARLVMVRVVAPPETVKARLAARTAGGSSHSDADWEVYRKLKPTEEMIRRRHYIVDASRNITPALNAIFEEMKE
jgi:predicted kinase